MDISRHIRTLLFSNFFCPLNRVCIYQSVFHCGQRSCETSKLWILKSWEEREKWWIKSENECEGGERESQKFDSVRQKYRIKGEMKWVKERGWRKRENEREEAE